MTMSRRLILAVYFNTALDAAEGEFVLPLPSDVTIPKTTLYELAAGIGCQPTAMCCTPMKTVWTAKGSAASRILRRLGMQI
jgi:hypothetical protein